MLEKRHAQHVRPCSGPSPGRRVETRASTGSSWPDVPDLLPGDRALSPRRRKNALTFGASCSKTRVNAARSRLLAPARYSSAGLDPAQLAGASVTSVYEHDLKLGQSTAMRADQPRAWRPRPGVAFLDRTPTYRVQVRLGNQPAGR